MVHADGTDTACNGGGTIPVGETSSQSEFPAASISSNFDGAFDFYSTGGGLTASTSVVTVLDPTSVIIDAVLLANDGLVGTVASTQTAAALVVSDAGEWTTTAGTVPAGGFVDAEFRANAVLDLDATDTTRTGESIRRTDDADTDHMGGWAQGASSFGALNAGQTAL